LQTPEFLDVEDVLQIHDRQIQRFGGAPGTRDRTLLESALAQPQATFSGELLHATIWAQAAAYLFHLALNHPFVDGNKRTAFAVMDIFLRVNGYVLTLTQDQKYELVIQVVERNLSKDSLVTYLEQSATPRL